MMTIAQDPKIEAERKINREIDISKNKTPPKIHREHVFEPDDWFQNFNYTNVQKEQDVEE